MSKHDKDIFSISYVPNLCFFTLNYFHFMPNNFLLNKTSLKLSNSIAILTSFTVLCYLPKTNFFIEYIFDFNPTNSFIITPPNSSFILPITFLLVSLRNFDSFE